MEESRDNTRRGDVNRWLALVAGACAIFLALEPVNWLVRTWLDPAWDSQGELVFLIVLGFAIWSGSSRRISAGSATMPAVLFGLTAIVRVVGHVLAINVVGALALVLDVYAAGVLLGLRHRVRSVSPFWLAALFGMSLPLERIAQRVVGFGLQQVSAAGACGALKVGFDDVVCRGTDIVLAGSHVLVDLPCSGARGLLLLAAMFAGLSALTKPTAVQALAGVAVTVMSALVSNTIRITLLAVGIAHKARVDVDVMAQPWHDIVGLFCLGLGLIPIVVWSRLIPERVPTIAAPHAPLRHRVPIGVVVALIAACIAVAATPHRPVDVSRAVESVELPEVVAGVRGISQPLSEREIEYFTEFGGAAAKTSYGDHSLLVVRTSAPLRHLHAPDECLRGAGYDVYRLGISHGELPGALYRAVDPDGTAWRVIVSYVGNRGSRATSISEAVWRWLRDPSETWTAVERVSPWNAPPQDFQAFDRAVRGYLFSNSITINPITTQELR